MACFDPKYLKATKKKLILGSLTLFNVSAVYAASNMLALSFFGYAMLVPSLYVNWVYLHYNKIMFNANRAYVVNMYLKPNGK